DAHEGFQRPGLGQCLGGLQAHLAQPCGGLRADVAHLERYGAHASVSMYTRAISSSPLWSSTPKRAGTGLSRSNTPTRAPSAPGMYSGTTSSERDAASQAIWPGNASTSSTRWVWRELAAAPQTPRPS